MASGQPFSEREKTFIRANKDKMTRGMIAQQLGILYPDDNSGYRSWRSVRQFIYRESTRREPAYILPLPRELLAAASRAGFDLEEFATVSRDGIIVSIRQ